MRRGRASDRCLLCLETLPEPVGGFRGVLRLSVCLFVGGIYAGVNMRLFVSGWMSFAQADDFLSSLKPQDS